MLAVRLHGPGDLRRHDEPAPEVHAGDELVRVTGVGLCGSDRHWYLEGAIGDSRVERPLVLGHEIAGVIVDGPRRGERVAVDPADPCRECPTCLADMAHLCPHMRFAGHGTNDGGLRELMAWPGRLLHRLPAAIGDNQAVLLEPLGVALHALDLISGQRRSAAVVGCGPIGLLLVQLLKDAGWGTVVAADPVAHRLDAARSFGATADGGSTDVVFEVSGATAGLAQAIDMARPAGQVVLVGIPMGDRTEFRASAARRKELTLSITRRMRGADLPRAIGLAAARRVALEPLITASFPLEQAPAAFEAVAAFEGIKTVVRPS